MHAERKKVECNRMQHERFFHAKNVLEGLLRFASIVDTFESESATDELV
jgi:hypothetical protein